MGRLTNRCPRSPRHAGGAFPQLFYQKYIDDDPLSGYMNNVRLDYLNGLPNRKIAFISTSKKQVVDLFKRIPNAQKAVSG